MSERVSLRMRFRDSNDRLVSFTVSPPVNPPVIADVTDMMNLIVSSNAFFTYTEGDVVEKVDAQIITVTGEVIEEWE